MKQPVKDSRSNDRITEDFVPLTKTSIRGQDHRSSFIAPGDELEEEVSAVAVDRNIADLVDDEEFRLAVELQSLFDAILGVSLGQAGDKRQGLGEVGSIAFSDCLDAQGDS